MVLHVLQSTVFLVSLGLGTAGSDIDYKEGWGGIDLHCRDNANKPVDWWFLYKPPAATDSPLDIGSNFTYFSSTEFQQRWLSSSVLISGENMLFHTTSPLFRPTYHEHMGALIYSDRVGTGRVSGTSASGVVMADFTGGLWLMHSLPDYPNFAYDELKEGHLIACFSLPRGIDNTLGELVKLVAANVTYVRMPRKIRPQLPNWIFPRDPSEWNITAPKRYIQQLKFTGIPNKVVILSRTPGETRCLYRDFAKQYGIVLDVYGQTKHKKTSYCSKEFSVRNIDSISLNTEDKPVYINGRPDHMRFAVSTAAPWQQHGASRVPQYWTCLSNVDKEDSTGKGGYLLCVNNYAIWRSFSNLKVSEPVCEQQKSTIHEKT